MHALAPVPGANLLYVGAHDGVYAGENLGRTWQKLPGMPALVPPAADVDAMQVLFDPPGGRLFAAGHSLGVVVTTDNGNSWQPAMAGLPLPPDAHPGQGRHADVHALAADPQRPEVLYAWVDGFGLYATEDVGAHWVARSAQAAGVDVIALAVAPADSNTLYAGGQGGFASSSDAGRTWRLTLSAFNAQMITGIWADPAHAGVLLATTDEDGLWRSEDGGSRWERVRLRVLPDTLADVKGDAQNPQRVYLISQEGRLFASRDGGKTWTAI